MRPTWVQVFTVGIAEGLTSRLKYLTFTPLPTHFIITWVWTRALGWENTLIVMQDSPLRAGTARRAERVAGDLRVKVVTCPKTVRGTGLIHPTTFTYHFIMKFTDTLLYTVFTHSWFKRWCKVRIWESTEWWRECPEHLILIFCATIPASLTGIQP
jgi:hypothetical protein